MKGSVGEKHKGAGLGSIPGLGAGGPGGTAGWRSHHLACSMWSDEDGGPGSRGDRVGVVHTWLAVLQAGEGEVPAGCVWSEKRGQHWGAREGKEIHSEDRNGTARRVSGAQLSKDAEPQRGSAYRVTCGEGRVECSEPSPWIQRQLGTCWVYVVVLDLRCCAGFSYGAWASHCGGFSCCSSQALEHRLSSCGTQA